MDKQKLIIKGGNRIEGELALHGAKNAALPLLAATVLIKDGECVIHNCPRLTDVDAALRILSHIGVKCRRDGSTVISDASAIGNCEIPVSLMREMRSSIVFLGSVLGRTGHCRMSYPGGCELGPRPKDLHLAALRSMGAIIEETHGFLDCTAPKGLKGTSVSLSFPSVGATENVMLAAVTASGVTEIEGAAKEPEICDLASFLVSCGADIKGAGTDRIIICGKNKLSGCEYSVMPDRIAAVTYPCCAAVTGGELILTGADIAHIGAVVPVLKDMGCRIYSFGRDSIYIKATERLRAPHTVRTMPYPGFPTDAQAPLMATCTVADGTAVFVENIFDNRYRHVSELLRMGAVIKTEGRVAVVQGVRRLSAAEIVSPDLRGGAALVIAALGADGTSSIGGISHIDRGYESIEKALYSVGADIKRI